ncbi:cyclase [Caulobacter vibrioides]|uniref:Cyclase n=1 Tax=Caulobacter vibrioides TaxID=155892 RepID=A0A290N1K5_CAUVI|nr:SRPBCC family protein [Caulobacter vibrioides]ATC33774.1 cyclase [Caulobacter vibrioides]
MRWILPFLLAIGVAAPARAASEWAVKDGSVQVEAHADEQGRAVVRASIEIAAPPSVVFGVILDCGRAARMSPGVKRCRVVSRAADGSEVREHTVKWGFFLPALQSRSRLSLQPDREIRFTCIGGDIRACDGFWRLEPLEGGTRTRVTYDLWATAPYAAPAGLVSSLMRRTVPQSLAALRRECEGG